MVSHSSLLTLGARGVAVRILSTRSSKEARMMLLLALGLKSVLMMLGNASESR